MLGASDLPPFNPTTILLLLLLCMHACIMSLLLLLDGWLRYYPLAHQL